MTVWVCYDVCYNYDNTFRYVAKVVDSLDKALKFVSEVGPTETDWREFEEFAAT